jgi:four helix bundle protein
MCGLHIDCTLQVAGAVVIADCRGANSALSLLSTSVTSNFRKLVAYRVAAELADEMHFAVRGWSEYDRTTVGLQLVRAADSVHANIAEAAGRWTKTERRNFLRIARGSLYEAEGWITRAHARGLLSEDYEDRLSEIARTLNGLIKRPTPE